MLVGSQSSPLNRHQCCAGSCFHSSAVRCCSDFFPRLAIHGVDYNTPGRAPNLTAAAVVVLGLSVGLRFDSIYSQQVVIVLDVRSRFVVHVLKNRRRSRIKLDEVIQPASTHSGDYLWVPLSQLQQ